MKYLLLLFVLAVTGCSSTESYTATYNHTAPQSCSDIDCKYYGAMHTHLYFE